jgi:hypothetical protein
MQRILPQVVVTIAAVFGSSSPYPRAFHSRNVSSDTP